MIHAYKVTLDRLFASLKGQVQQVTTWQGCVFGLVRSIGSEPADIGSNSEPCAEVQRGAGRIGNLVFDRRLSA